MTENKRFKHMEHHQDDGQLIYYGIEDTSTGFVYNVIGSGMYDVSEKQLIKVLNELNDENEQLKTFLEALKEELSLADRDNTQLEKENKELRKDLNDCKKLKGKRLNKIRNHRAVIEDLGGSIRAYKGQISQLNEKIEKIQEAMEDTGALTKRQLEMILND